MPELSLEARAKELRGKVEVVCAHIESHYDFYDEKQALSSCFDWTELRKAARAQDAALGDLLALVETQRQQIQALTKKDDARPSPPVLSGDGQDPTASAMGRIEQSGEGQV